MHSVPPDGTTNLLLVTGPDGTRHRRRVGPSLAAAVVPVAQGWAYAGLRLRPEAAEAATGSAPLGTVGTVEEASGGDAIFAAIEMLTETSEDGLRTDRLVTALASIKTDALVAAAVDALIESGGAASLRDLADGAGLGPRQFRRRFAEATGLSPKQYASVQRIRRALLLSLERPGWASVAAEAGFADQAHLSRVLRTSFGTAPRRIGGYIAGIRHEFVTHVRFVQDQQDSIG